MFDQYLDKMIWEESTSDNSIKYARLHLTLTIALLSFCELSQF